MSDEIFFNHQNYCVHVKLYLTLRHIIKHADIDLLRYSFRKIAVAFQFETIESSKYVKAFLRLFHVIDFSTIFVKLQKTILISSLINLQKQFDTNFETDRLLKLLNLNLKIFQRERFLFSNNHQKYLERWVIIDSYMLAVRSTVEKTLDISFSEKHSSKFSFENIWNMILHLTLNSLALIKENRFMMNLIQNMLFADLFRLNENICKYNEQMMFNELSFEDDIDFYFEIFQKFEFTVVVPLKKKNINDNNDFSSSVESTAFMKKNDTFFS